MAVVVVNGQKFGSKTEYEYYCKLFGLLQLGKIKSLEREVRFNLKNIPLNDDLTYNPKARDLFYKCDFKVVDNYDRVHYIEYKGWLRRHSRIKMAYCETAYGINIRVVPDRAGYRDDFSFLFDKNLPRCRYNLE